MELTQDNLQEFVDNYNHLQTDLEMAREAFRMMSAKYAKLQQDYSALSQLYNSKVEEEKGKKDAKEEEKPRPVTNKRKKAIPAKK
jgi:predicted lipid-binding transport protein (Tim44 family)